MGLHEVLEKNAKILAFRSKSALENSALALSQLTNDAVTVGDPVVQVIRIDTVLDMLRGNPNRLTVIELAVYGKIRGDIFLILSHENTELLVGKVGSRLRRGSIDEDMVNSILAEIGNIVAASYVTILGQSFNATLIPSVPHVSRVDAETFRRDFLWKGGEHAEYTLMLVCEFFINKTGFTVYFLFLLPSHFIDSSLEEI